MHCSAVIVVGSIHASVSWNNDCYSHILLLMTMIVIMIKAVTYYHTDSWIIFGWKRQGQMKQEVRNAYIPKTNKQRTTPSFDILSSSKITLKNEGLWGDQNYSLFPKPDGLKGFRTGRQSFVKLGYFVFQFPFRNQCHISLLKGVVGILFFFVFLERLGLADGPREDSI